MAHIWMKSDDAWHPAELPADGCTLGEALRIRRVSGSDEDAWALLAAPGASILVNGLPVSHGLAILSDRDEIRLGAAPDAPGRAAPIYFATERLAAIAPYPSTGRGGMCPRCKQAMVPGESAVRCPGCRLWHHATDRLPCWTHVEHCAACDQPTSLDAGFQWTPEDLQ